MIRTTATVIQLLLIEWILRIAGSGDHTATTHEYDYELKTLTYNCAFRSQMINGETMLMPHLAIGIIRIQIEKKSRIDEKIETKYPISCISLALVYLLPTEMKRRMKKKIWTLVDRVSKKKVYIVNAKRM